MLPAAEMVMRHRITGTQTSSSLNHFTESISINSLRDQFVYINSIPNIHYDLKNISHFSYQRNLSCRLEDGPLPISTRNRLIHFYDTDNHIAMNSEIQKIIEAHCTPKDHFFSGGACYDSEQAPPLKKRRIYRSRTKQILISDISSPDTYPTVGSLSRTENNNLYQLFLHQLLTNGTIICRSHSNDKDVFVINSYDTDNGLLQPLNFSHVVVEHIDGEHIITCSCQAYRLLQEILKEEAPIDHSSGCITCMHARLVKDYLLSNYSCIFGETIPSSKILKALFQAVHTPFDSVVIIGPSENVSTVKFSVRGTDDSLSFVHLSDHGSYIACQSGGCNVLMGLTSRKKTSKLIDISQEQNNLCPHLSEMIKQEDVWATFISTCDTTSATVRQSMLSQFYRDCPSYETAFWDGLFRVLSLYSNLGTLLQVVNIGLSLLHVQL